MHVPFFDITASADPTRNAEAGPNDRRTGDFAKRYDFVADYPNYAPEVIAVANAVAGLAITSTTYRRSTNTIV